MSNDSALSAFFLWRQKNVLNECRARILRTEHKISSYTSYSVPIFMHHEIADVLYKCTRTCLQFRIQEPRQQGCCRMRPLAREILSLNAKSFQDFQEFQAPLRCTTYIITGCKAAQDHGYLILHSPKDYAGFTVYPSLPFYQQVPVLENHNPWFLERVSSAVVRAVSLSHRKGSPCSSAPITF